MDLILRKKDNAPSFRRPFSSLPSEQVSPSLLRTLEAAGRQENLAGAALSKLGRFNIYNWIQSFWDQNPNRDDPDFDAWKQISGTRYEDYAREFAKARSKDDVLSIMRDIDLEMEDRQVLADAGGWGMMSVLMAGTLDPVNLIPFGGAASRIAKIPGMLRRLAMGAVAQTAIGGVTAAAQEFGLGALQHTRTREEMMMGISGGAFLSGVLGGAASLLPAPVEKFGKKAFLDWQGRNLQEVKVELLRQGGTYSRQDFRNDLVWEWDLPSEQVDAALAHFDATILRRWSDKYNLPVEKFYEKYLGQVVNFTKEELNVENILDDFGKKIDPDSLAARLESESGGQFKAATDFNYRKDGRAILVGLRGSVDLSSLLHEMVHVWRNSLDLVQSKKLGNFFEIKNGNWTIEAEEKVASAVESLFFDGKPSRPIPEEAKPKLDQFRNWLLEIWGRLRYTPVADETNKEVRNALERYWMPWSGKNKEKIPIVEKKLKRPPLITGENELKLGLEEHLIGLEEKFSKYSKSEIVKIAKERDIPVGNKGRKILIPLILEDEKIKFKKGEIPKNQWELTYEFIDKIKTDLDLDAEDRAREVIPRLFQPNLKTPLFQKMNRTDYGLEPIPWVPDFAVKWAAKLGPGARLFTTQYSDAAGKLAEKLISLSVYLGKHWEGRSTEIPPVEIRVSKRINQIYSEAKKTMLDEFVKYRARIAKEPIPEEAQFIKIMKMRVGDYLNKRMGNKILDEMDFRRLIYDAWGGKETEISEVKTAAATIRKIMDNLGRELSTQGLLPDNLKIPLEKGLGHRPRIYRPHVVKEYKRTFLDIVRAQAELGEISGETRPIEEIANDITNSFNGNLWHEVGKIDFDNLEKLEKEKSKFLHSKVLDFDDDFLIGQDIYDDLGRVIDTVDFIETDPDKILKIYLRSVIPDLELQKQFGSIDMIDQFKEVLADYDNIISKTRGSTGNIEDEKRHVLRDLVALRDRIRGTDRFNGDPQNSLRRMNNAIMRLNGTLYLGNVLLSSFADPGRAVMRYGLNPFAKKLSAIIGDPKRWKSLRGWERTIGAATDILTNETSRYLEFADLQEPIRKNSWAEEKIEFLSDQFGWLSGLEIWTIKWKELTGLISSHYILDKAKKIKDSYNLKEFTFKADGTIEGKLPIEQKEIQQLAQMGFTARELMDVDGEFSKYGDKENPDLFLPQTDKWTNEAIKNKFEAAIIQEMNNVIITPTMGDRPIMSSSPWGAMFLQFKSFTLASMQKVILSGLQQRDKNIFQGALVMTMLGAMGYFAKQLSRGNTPTSNPSELLVEAIDNSGLLGIFSDINGFIELASGGRTGIRPMVGEGIMSRYRSRDILDLLMGPTGSTIKHAVTGIVKPSLTLDMTDQNLYSLNKIIPYSQMWYWRWIGERLRADIVDKFELKEEIGKEKNGTEG